MKKKYPGFVEVIGLPGAGKTTFMKLLLAEKQTFPFILKPKNLRGASLRKKLLEVLLRLLLESPLSLFRLVARKGGRWLICKSAYRLASMETRSDSGVLLDSGVLQPSVSAVAEYTENQVSTNDIIAILKILPKPRAIIYIKSDVNTALQRYLIREQLTGKRVATAVSEASFIQAQSVCEQILTMFEPERVKHLKGSELVSNASLKDTVTWLNYWFDNRNGRVL